MPKVGGPCRWPCRHWRCIGWRMAPSGLLTTAALGLLGVACAAAPPPAGWPECAEQATCLFTTESLSGFVEVEKGDTVLLSVVSYVFNVSQVLHYYGRVGSYSSLAGTDCSRVLGTMSMEEEDVRSHNLVDLTEDQWEELFIWVDKFQEKYQLVGRLVDWRPGITMEDINSRSGFSLKAAPKLPDGGVGPELEPEVSDGSRGADEL
mmetsp:Transcript_53561/g.135969  ORF Transcript_53561/g.135969 Transcript_53561/m.135969 type:complete len:206 (-) Transcript_53561:7-624(-)